MTTSCSIPLTQKTCVPPFIGALSLAIALTFLRYIIAHPGDLDLLLNEEASIYLHAAEKNFFELFMIPDSNYINFINKFCAALSLKVFKAFDNFALVQNLTNWFVAALFSTIFLLKKFEVLIVSFRIRLALCIYLYLLPIFDMHMVFGQGYYVIFALFFYILTLYKQTNLSTWEIVLICTTAPFAVFSKPVFFIFGFAFLGVFLQGLRECILERRIPCPRLWLLFYLLVLYIFQAWFIFAHHEYMAEYTNSLDRSMGFLSLLLFLGKKVFIFLGYGLICPLAHIIPRQLATPLCFTAGLIAAGLFVRNIQFFVKERDTLRLTTLLLLSGSVILSLYGAVSVNFLYHRFFVQDIFAVQWSHRLIFPIILIALFSLVFYLQRLADFGKNICLIFICLLCVIGYNITAWGSLQTGYAPSFTWKQTRPLLDNRYSFIPHAHGMQFYYIRGMNYVSEEISLTIADKDTLVAPKMPKGRKVRYLMLKQTPNQGAIALAASDTLNVIVNDIEYKARLVNPGINSQYLFVFNNSIPSENLTTFQIAAQEVALTGKSFVMHIIGFQE